MDFKIKTITSALTTLILNLTFLRIKELRANYRPLVMQNSRTVSMWQFLSPN